MQTNNIQIGVIARLVETLRYDDVCDAANIFETISKRLLNETFLMTGKYAGGTFLGVWKIFYRIAPT